MCSSSKCDMAGLLSGPVGNIVSIGIKALTSGTPVGPRTAESLVKPTEQDKIKEFYDNVETHLKGALKVLQPALEIKRILTSECKSAGYEQKAPISANPILYYSPQNVKNHVCACAARGCCSKKLSSKSASSDKSDPMCMRKNDQSATKKAPQSKQSSNADKTGNKCSKTAKKKHSSDSESRSSKNHSKSSKSLKGNESCSMCDVNLKDNRVLAVLPCKHMFCYTCLAKAKSACCCQKCDSSFDMKNITQIFT